eukprot:1561151-Amphidinium_carterae.1
MPSGHSSLSKTEARTRLLPMPHMIHRSSHAELGRELPMNHLVGHSSGLRGTASSKASSA